MFRNLIFTILLILSSQHCISQDNDSVVISKIYNYALLSAKAYDDLHYLCNKIGARLSGSDGADKAVAWAKETLDKEKVAKITLQEVKVPHWVRNNIESFHVTSKGVHTGLNICSLGGSIATPAKGLKAKIIEVKTFEELESLGRKNIEGNIVFFNAPLQQSYVNTFRAYGEKGMYRWAGAQNAAKYGAVASISRSLTLALDDHPHTGSMGYNDTIQKIPACAISTIGAERLSDLLKKDPDAIGELILNCETFEDKLSNNVIAEIKGSEFPEEIILVGGHLDSWDTGTGAHDDGAGCVQSMEILRIFDNLGIKPKRTIRVVLFMNEENGLRGGKKYAETALEKKEKHIAAIESDAGGFTPQGFSIEADSVNIEKIRKYKELLLPYGLFHWEKGHGGSDIGPLGAQGAVLIGLYPDSQRYFDYHHTEIDVFENINKRELHLGAAAMASLVYLISEYGIEEKSSLQKF
jgi:carboxypeptidase Q